MGGGGQLWAVVPTNPHWAFGEHSTLMPCEIQQNFSSVTFSEGKEREQRHTDSDYELRFGSETRHWGRWEGCLRRQWG